MKVRFEVEIGSSSDFRKSTFLKDWELDFLPPGGMTFCLVDKESDPIKAIVISTQCFANKSGRIEGKPLIHVYFHLNWTDLCFQETIEKRRKEWEKIIQGFLSDGWTS